MKQHKQMSDAEIIGLSMEDVSHTSHSLKWPIIFVLILIVGLILAIRYYL